MLSRVFALLVVVLVATPAYAGPFIYGPDCGQCHTPIPQGMFYHIDKDFFNDEVPAGDGIYQTWGAEHNMPSTNMPSTPLPGTLPLMGAGLGVLGLLGWRSKWKAHLSRSLTMRQRV